MDHLRILPVSRPPDNTRFIFSNTRASIRFKTGAALEGPLGARLPPPIALDAREAFNKDT